MAEMEEVQDLPASEVLDVHELHAQWTFAHFYVIYRTTEAIASCDQCCLQQLQHLLLQHSQSCCSFLMYSEKCLPWERDRWGGTGPAANAGWARAVIHLDGPVSGPVSSSRVGAGPQPHDGHSAAGEPPS